MAVVKNCVLCHLGVGFEYGKTQRQVAAEYGIGKSSVGRHRRHLGQAQEEPDIEVDSLDDLVERYGIDRKDLQVRGLTVKDSTGSWVRLINAEGTNPERMWEDIDPVAILNSLEHPEAEKQSGPGVFVVSVNDWQTGKAEGGGTPALIERIHRSVAKAADRAAELNSIGRDLGTLIVIGGGDIIEGCTIYPNQTYGLDLTQSEQIEMATTLVLYTLDNLAPLFERVIVLATKGNHGENRVDGYKTAPRDNNDTMVFRLAKMATDRDPRLQHIEYVICKPEEESAWVDVPGTGWRLGTTHGDIFGKFAKGQTKMLKAWDWYKNMAAARFPIGSVDVLVTHHFHHEEKADWGSCMWVQTRAQDGGSAYFEQFSGQYSESGMLSFVMTPDNRYQDEAIL